jgi:hypothetical protein
VVTKSIPKRYTQSQLTKIFALQLNRPGTDLKFLWHNFTDKASLRFSMTGFQFALKELKLHAYTFELEKPLTNKNLLQLERFFPGPYYYWSRTSKFIVFDQQDAVWLELQGSDLSSYLENLESST